MGQTAMKRTGFVTNKAETDNNMAASTGTFQTRIKIKRRRSCDATIRQGAQLDSIPNTPSGHLTLTLRSHRPRFSPDFENFTIGAKSANFGRVVVPPDSNRHQFGIINKSGQRRCTTSNS